MHFLVSNKIPKTHIAVEKKITINNLNKRFDVVVFDRNYNPLMLVECKSPSVEINQGVFDQISIYNLKIRSKFLMITNGLNNLYFKIDEKINHIFLLKNFPLFMKIAIVILNWNGVNLLKEFFPSVYNNSNEHSVYLIDNNSGDGSVDFIRNSYPKVKVILNSKNYSYAKGYNEGLKHVNEDIYCLLNNDVEVTRGWLNPILDEFKKDKSLVVCQPKYWITRLNKCLNMLAQLEDI